MCHISYVSSVCAHVNVMCVMFVFCYLHEMQAGVLLKFIEERGHVSITLDGGVGYHSHGLFALYVHVIGL